MTCSTLPFILAIFGELSTAIHVLTDQDWENYKMKYEKFYESLSEEMKRRKIWEDNMHLIEEYNDEASKGEYSSTQGDGPFTDMTDEEFESQGCCVEPEDHIDIPVHDNYRIPRSGKSKKNLPDRVDWRDQGVLTPAKYQGPCGCCWSFATVGAVESRHAIKTGILYELSEQQILDCDSKNNGCGPGNIKYAYQYIFRNGLQPNETYPYIAEQEACQYDREQVVVQITGFKLIPPKKPLAMMKEIALNGPVSAAINSRSRHIKNYRSGVVDDPKCKPKVNHFVLIVGYGSTRKGKEYWIVKNSWGEGHGEQGYMKIVRKKNMCGIERHIAFPRLP